MCILTWVFAFWAAAAPFSSLPLAFVVGDVAHCGFGPRPAGDVGARLLCQTKLFVDVVDEEAKKGKLTEKGTYGRRRDASIG